MITNFRKLLRYIHYLQNKKSYNTFKYVIIGVVSGVMITNYHLLLR